MIGELSPTFLQPLTISVRYLVIRGGKLMVFSSRLAVHGRWLSIHFWSGKGFRCSIENILHTKLVAKGFYMLFNRYRCQPSRPLLLIADWLITLPRTLCAGISIHWWKGQLSLYKQKCLPLQSARLCNCWDCRGIHSCRPLSIFTSVWLGV